MARPPSLDKASEAVLYGGANVTELALLFGMERRDVTRRLHGLPPYARRNGADVWMVKDAATRLARLPEDVVARVLRMNHSDLPPMLRKEYWTGELQRLKAQREMGHLWPVEAVVERAGAAFKHIRMALLLMVDSVERETALTDEQRRIIRKLIDVCMADAQVRLVDEFQARVPPPEDDEVADDAEI